MRGRPTVRNEVMEAYYVLWNENLRCFPGRETPSLGWLMPPKVIVVACRAGEGGPIVGVLAVKDDAVYFPVMQVGRYQEILASMIVKAHEANGGYLKATTTNELILSTAVQMGVGVTRDGNRLEMR